MVVDDEDDIADNIIIVTKSTACEEGQGVCAYLMVVISVVLIFATFPFSLCLVVKVVQVYNGIIMLLHSMLCDIIIYKHCCDHLHENHSATLVGHLGRG